MSQFIFYLFIFLFGMTVGSFLNVLIARQSQEKSIRGRSACPQCGHQLSWRDLIPLVSFFILRGQCRYCGEKISWQYPLVETITGALFLFLFLVNLSTPDMGRTISMSDAIGLIYLFFITSCLIVIFVSDLKYFIIPDEIIVAGVVGAFLYKFFEIWDFSILNLLGNWKLEIGNWQAIGYQLLAAIAAGSFFLVIVLATKGRGMGLGDVKFAFLMGLILGWPKISVALLLAFVSGALIGLGLIIAGKAKMKSEVPFGVFLSAATFLVMIWGGRILSGYFNLIF
jgi:leader peptidase (prepilin peptidase)/N-methyltransferase